MLIKINGVELFYKKSGSGPPLLLLHGNGEDHTIFNKLGEKLGRHFTLYAIDSRGHGQSQRAEVFSYDLMAEDVYLFIQDLNLKKIHVIGFSDGAIISLLLSLKHPEVINKMALLGVNLKPADFTDKSLGYINRVYWDTRDPLFKLMLDEPNIELSLLENIAAPTYVLAGESDIIKREIFFKVAETIPNSKLKILKDHTHDSYIVNNDMLYEEFLDFFS
ncbi:MAG: alpha/beta hydrolase [Deltaproteobacteria bacterium]|jgi:pimeloyl-ACP methyl ester carboxylesterase|nr:alpha/beta hydrolase [Deltaproteobacteria bacterium]